MNSIHVIPVLKAKNGYCKYYHRMLEGRCLDCPYKAIPAIVKSKRGS